MNTKSSSNKWLIYLGIIVAVFTAGYFMFSKPESPEGSSLLQAEVADPAASEASARILNLLNQIEKIEIDSNFFKGAAYQTLVDYSIEIPPVDVGRPNPFAPLPGGTNTGTSTR